MVSGDSVLSRHLPDQQWTHFCFLCLLLLCVSRRRLLLLLLVVVDHFHWPLFSTWELHFGLSVCRGSTLSNCFVVFVANVEHVGRTMNKCDVMCSVAFDDDDERVMMNLRWIQVLSWFYLAWKLFADFLTVMIYSVWFVTILSAISCPLIWMTNLPDFLTADKLPLLTANWFISSRQPAAAFIFYCCRRRRSRVSLCPVREKASESECSCPVSVLFVVQSSPHNILLLLSPVCNMIYMLWSPHTLLTTVVLCCVLYCVSSAVTGH